MSFAERRNGKWQSRSIDRSRLPLPNAPKQEQRRTPEQMFRDLDRLATRYLGEFLRTGEPQAVTAIVGTWQALGDLVEHGYVTLPRSQAERLRTAAA